MRATTGVGENTGPVGGNPAFDGVLAPILSCCATVVVVVGGVVVVVVDRVANVGVVVLCGLSITGAEFGMKAGGGVGLTVGGAGEYGDDELGGGMG